MTTTSRLWSKLKNWFSAPGVAPAVPGTVLHSPLETPPKAQDEPPVPAPSRRKPVEAPVEPSPSSPNSGPAPAAGGALNLAGYRPGEVIANSYEVKDVRAGNMGTVYIACHRAWQIDVAVKVPQPALINSAEGRARFEREAEAWTALGLHPNIAYCYYVQPFEQVPLLVVEYVDGGNLRAWIEDGRCFDLRRSLDFALQFCHGLEHAHGRGLIHRDIKPENVLLTQDGSLKITDFGIVRMDDRPDEKAAIATPAAAFADPHQAGFTIGGGMGTPAYMAPEQWVDAHDVDARTDLFAFGGCLYEMLAGRRPYDGYAIGPRQEAPDPAKLRGDTTLSPALCGLMRRLVDWDPTNRPESARAVREEIAAIYQERFGEPSLFAELPQVSMLADGLNNCGASYQFLEKHKEAEEAWVKALAADPMHLEATYNRGLMLWRSGEITDVGLLQRIEAVASGKEKSARLLTLLGLVHLERGDRQCAEGVLAEALRRAPADPEIQAAWSRLQKELPTAAELVRTLEGHSNSVNAVAFSPNGRFFASGSSDETVRLWDVQSGTCIKYFLAQAGWVLTLAFTPDGRFLISGHGDDSLRLWEVNTGACICTFAGHTGWVRAIAVTPDGRFAVSASHDKTLRLWELASGQCVKIFTGHSGPVNAVASAGNGRLIISASDDWTLRLWELASGDCLSVYQGHSKGVLGVVFIAGDRLIASVSADTSLRLWLVEGRREEPDQRFNTIRGHTASVTAVAIIHDPVIGVTGSSNKTQLWQRYASPHSPLIGVTGSDDRTLRLWNFRTDQCLRTVELPRQVKAIAVASDGQTIACGSVDTVVRLYHLSAGSPSNLAVCRPEGTQSLLNRTAEVNRLLADARVALAAGRPATAYEIAIKCLAVEGFGHYREAVDVVRTAGQYGRILSLREASLAGNLRGHDGRINAVDVSGDGCTVVSGGEDTTIRVWDVASGRNRGWSMKTDTVRTVALTPDGKCAVAGYSNGQLVVRDLSADGQLLWKATASWFPIDTVAVSPDGHLLVSESNHRDLKVWELNSGRCLRTLAGPDCAIRAVAISPDGRFVLSGSNDNTLTLWAVESAECLRRCEGHTGTVNGVAFAPDGRFAVSVSNDQTVRLWNLTTGECVRTLTGHTGAVNAVTLTADGRFAISASDDKTLRLWNLGSGDCLSTLLGHTGEICDVAFSADSSLAVSAGTDATIGIWRLLWNFEFPAQNDWDEGARPFLESFLWLHRPVGEDGISRIAKPAWHDQDFEKLIAVLQLQGYGWLRPESVRNQLERMSAAGPDNKSSRNSGLVESKSGPKTEVVKTGFRDSVDYFMQALMCLRVRSYAEALEWYDKALEEKKADGLPDSGLLGMIWLHKGICYSRLDRHEDALVCFTGALEYPLAKQTTTAAWLEKGKSLAALSRWEEAERCFEQVLELDPENTDVTKIKENLHLA